MEFLLRAIDDGFVEFQVLTFANRTMPVHAFTILSFEADPPAVFLDTLSGGFFDEGDAAEYQYSTIFEHLRSIALGPAESRRVIEVALTNLPR